MLREDIHFVSDNFTDEYQNFILSIPQTQITVSLKFRELLKKITRAQPRYFIKMERESVVAALPIFEQRGEKTGKVHNSLPFFGSPGGLLLDPEKTKQDRLEIGQELMTSYFDYCHKKNIISSCIRSHPYHNNYDIISEQIKPNFKVKRINQKINLLDIKKDENIEEGLMNHLHQKTRNHVRKAKKEGVRIDHSPEPKFFEMLYEMQKNRMEAKGGDFKSRSFFWLVMDIFEYNKDYRLYYAKYENQVIGCLLVFFFNQTAEYFVPGFKYDFKTLQPNSAMIFEALKYSLKRGLSFWNWGGTRPAQKGVFNFKKRWGTNNKEYYYSIFCFDKEQKLLCQRPDTIKKQYPYFYIVPFNELTTDKNGR